MNRHYHILEQKYYACEQANLENAAWKTYDENAFEIVKGNIGRATTGKVHLMMHKTSSFLGIMKVVPHRSGAGVLEELAILKTARDSPFLIRLIDGFLSPPDTRNQYFYMFLEYAPFKSLDHLTQAMKGVGSTNAKFYAIEIVSGLDFLHRKNIMHRDVKPENVFIRISGHAALGDFGSSMEATGGSRRICGTFLTRPPEVWKAETYSLPADVWMFAISIYNIISNKWPFMSPGKERQIQKVTAAKYSFDSKFCEASSDLITKLIQAEPNLRLTTKEILAHKYFQDITSPFDPPFTPQQLLNIYKYEEREGEVVTRLVSQQ